MLLTFDWRNKAGGGFKLEVSMRSREGCGVHGSQVDVSCITVILHMVLRQRMDLQRW